MFQNILLDIFCLMWVSISSSFNTLLMLFLGIEIMSIPLYILTGSDKRNLKGNEASLKYFLMGAFSTGIMLMGIALFMEATAWFFLYQMLLIGYRKSSCDDSCRIGFAGGCDVF